MPHMAAATYSSGIFLQHTHVITDVRFRFEIGISYSILFYILTDRRKFIAIQDSCVSPGSHFSLEYHRYSKYHLDNLKTG